MVDLWSLLSVASGFCNNGIDRKGARLSVEILPRGAIAGALTLCYRARRVVLQSEEHAAIPL